MDTHASSSLFYEYYSLDSPLRTAKEVLQKAKAMQKMDNSTLKDEANKNAFQTFAAGASAKSNESKKASDDKKMENQVCFILISLFPVCVLLSASYLSVCLFVSNLSAIVLIYVLSSSSPFTSGRYSEI